MGGMGGMDPGAMSEMMKNMPPEAIAEAAKAMGTDIDPAMAAKAAEQMKNMKPEQMERMMKMSAKLQDMGVKPGQKPEDMAGMASKLLEDPSFLQEGLEISRISIQRWQSSSRRRR